MLTRYTETELRAEIQEEIRQIHQRGDVAHPAWLTHKICRSHVAGLAVDAERSDEPEPDDVAFWRFCGYTTTRKLATDCINKLRLAETEDDSDTEPFLPGFAYLRPQYVVKRDGVDVEVPTGQMTVAELLAKADLYERNSATLAEHARELRRYAAMRDEATA